KEALAVGCLRMPAANAGQREAYHRAARVADEPQPLERGEPPPRVHLALLDIGRGVGCENRRIARGRWLRYHAINRPVTSESDSSIIIAWPCRFDRAGCPELRSPTPRQPSRDRVGFAHGC